jgi:hypothetical protein
MAQQVFKTYRCQVTGLPANPKFIELPCGCRVLNDEIHKVENEALNIVIIQCLECKKIIGLSPVFAIQNVS